MTDEEKADAPQRKDRRTTDTRSRICRVALELFVEKGLSRTTLQEIAERLGITKAALYYHFPSKSDLVRHVIRPAVDAVDDFLEEAERSEKPVRQLLEDYFDMLYSHRIEYLALVRDPTGLAEVDAEDWVMNWSERIQRLLAGSPADHERRIRAMIAASGLSRAAFLLTDIPLDELRRTSVDVAADILNSR